MSGQWTQAQFTYKIDASNYDGIGKYYGVVMTGEDTVNLPTANNQLVAGIVTNDEKLATALSAGGNQGGKNIAVQVQGVAMLKLSGTVAVNGRVILASGGTGIACPTTAGVYNMVGFAEKAGVSGDVIPVRLNFSEHVVQA
jgi:hypothetical protein